MGAWSGPFCSLSTRFTTILMRVGQTIDGWDPGVKPHPYPHPAPPLISATSGRRGPRRYSTRGRIRCTMPSPSEVPTARRTARPVSA